MNVSSASHMKIALAVLLATLAAACIYYYLHHARRTQDRLLQDNTRIESMISESTTGAQ